MHNQPFGDQFQAIAPGNGPLNGPVYGASCGARALINLMGESILDYLIGGPKTFTIQTGYMPTNAGNNTQLREGFVYFFSDADAFGHGLRIEQEIKANDLGELLCFGPHRNPNGSSFIRVWMWKYNGRTFKQVQNAKTAKAA